MADGWTSSAATLALHLLRGFGLPARLAPTSAPLSAISWGPHAPAWSRTGVPTRMPEVTAAGSGSYGITFRLSVMPAAAHRRSASAPEHAPGRAGRSAPGGCPCRRRPAASPRRPAPPHSACALATTCRAYVGELRPQRLAERHRLGRHGVHQRPALDEREHRPVDPRGQLRRAQDAAAARPAQRLVRGQRDHVRVRHRPTGCAPPATRPIGCATSASSQAPTSSAIPRNAA